MNAHIANWPTGKIMPLVTWNIRTLQSQMGPDKHETFYKGAQQMHRYSSYAVHNP